MIITDLTLLKLLFNDRAIYDQWGSYVQEDALLE